MFEMCQLACTCMVSVVLNFILFLQHHDTHGLGVVLDFKEDFAFTKHDFY
jgi:preprotein translocase subunit SecG